MMQYLAGMLGPLLFLALALVGCGGGGSAAPAAPQQPSIEINADSLFAGLFLDRSVGAQLQAIRPSWRVVDKAYTGLTMHALWSGYAEVFPGAPPPLQGPQPPFAQVPRDTGYVLIALGGNDALAGFTAAQYEQELRAAIAVIRAEGRVPLLAGFGPFEGSSFTTEVLAASAENNTITQRVSAELSVPRIAFDEPLSAAEAETLADHVHPTQIASDLKAQRLAEFVDQLSAPPTGISSIFRPASAGFSLPQL